MTSAPTEDVGVLLAELSIRHSRRHMPTRRVALDGAYLPMSGPAHGAALLASVVATNLPLIPEEQRELLPRLLRDAHPDSGGTSSGAAARIEELTEARSILLAVAADEVAAEG